MLKYPLSLLLIKEEKKIGEKPAVSAKVQYIKLLQLHARGQSVREVREKKVNREFCAKWLSNAFNNHICHRSALKYVF